MRKLILLLAAMPLIAAANSGEAGQSEVAGFFRDKPITVETLKNSGDNKLDGLSKELDLSGYNVALRESLIEYCTNLLLDEYFACYQISPGRDAVEKYISERPESLRQKLESFAGDPAFQKKCAIHLLLEKLVAREEITPNKIEIENFYHANQMRFRRPSNEKFAIIAIKNDSPDASTKAADTRARLLQGENFDRVAAEVDPEGAQKEIADELLMELRSITSSLPENSISDVINLGDLLVIIKMQKKIPAQIVPLKEVEAEIIEEISAQLDARALQKLLAPELSQIRFVQ